MWVWIGALLQCHCKVVDQESRVSLWAGGVEFRGQVFRMVSTLLQCH